MLSTFVLGKADFKGVFKVANIQRRNDAVLEFDQRTGGLNPDGTPGAEKEDPLVVRKELETSFGEARELDSFARPRFLISSGLGGLTVENMDAAATKKATLKAQRAGEITPNEAARQFENIKNIEAANAAQGR